MMNVDSLPAFAYGPAVLCAVWIVHSLSLYGKFKLLEQSLQHFPLIIALATEKGEFKQTMLQLIKTRFRVK